MLVANIELNRVSGSEMEFGIFFKEKNKHVSTG